MNRVYGEPVEVHTREDGHRPARFVWRGRSYAVRSVLEHWVVNREWWRDPDPAQAHPELEFWRVEADQADQADQADHSRSKDRDHDQDAGTYELRRDAAADTWTLRRVAD
ncbi:MAG TPA: DUF6504 family protein [Trebonia sp.]|jgi:hypothetical protein|nr:DUF6504 family protein [Trebonia sp.]